MATKHHNNAHALLTFTRPKILLCQHRATFQSNRKPVNHLGDQCDESSVGNVLGIGSLSRYRYVSCGCLQVLSVLRNEHKDEGKMENGMKAGESHGEKTAIGERR